VGHILRHTMILVIKHDQPYTPESYERAELDDGTKCKTVEDAAQFEREVYFEDKMETFYEYIVEDGVTHTVEVIYDRDELNDEDLREQVREDNQSLAEDEAADARVVHVETFPREL
jgi:allophanate hydrolase subunit 1